MVSREVSNGRRADEARDVSTVFDWKAKERKKLSLKLMESNTRDPAEDSGE